MKKWIFIGLVALCGVFSLLSFTSSTVIPCEEIAIKSDHGVIITITEGDEVWLPPTAWKKAEFRSEHVRTVTTNDDVTYSVK